MGLPLRPAHCSFIRKRPGLPASPAEAASRVKPPTRDHSTGEQDTDAIFRNIRGLAIGQLIEARDGKKLAEGNTATLEVDPGAGE
jgi:hypothetical protein